MKLNTTLFIVFLCIGFRSIAQIEFEKGYFITNDGQKVTCLIKNKDWENNPVKFEYMLNKNSNILTNTIEDVQEFGIDNFSRFERHEVAIDKSTNDLTYLSKVRTSTYVKETLFLKLLVEGKANLLLYKEGNLVRFFYKKENSKIKQLEYKIYETTNGRVAKNYNFRYQLSQDVSCDNLKTDRLKYTKKEIVNYFMQFNNCNGKQIALDFTKKATKSDINIRLKGGIGLGSFELYSFKMYSNDETDVFNPNIQYKLGVETEYVFPFQKNKWATFAMLSFQNYNASNNKGNYSQKINYTSTQLVMGARHYLFLKNQSKLFASTGIILDFPLNPSFALTPYVDLEFNFDINFFMGLGYVLNDKITLEVQYLFSRNSLSYYESYGSNFNSFGILMGYTLF